MDSGSRRRRTPRTSLSAGDNFTPRTLIQGFLQTAQTVRPSPKKKARITPSSKSSSSSSASYPPSLSSTSTVSSSSSSSAQQRRSRTPGTLPRPTPSSRRRSTRLQILATPGGSNPTPKGLIAGFLQAADIQTPAVHAVTRRSSPRKQPTPPSIKNDVQTRADSANVSVLESPAEVAFSRFRTQQPRGGGRTRRRQAIDAEEFAVRVNERMSQEDRAEENREEEAEGARDASTNRTLLESIVEEPLDVSMPRPDSTTRNTSDVQSPGGQRSSGRESRARRSLLRDESLQLPSTSTGPNVSVQESAAGDRRASHPSASSAEGDESLVDHQATQDTVQIQPSSNTDTEEEEEGQRGEEGDGGADEREDEGMEDGEEEGEEERRDEMEEGVEEEDVEERRDEMGADVEEGDVEEEDLEEGDVDQEDGEEEAMDVGDDTFEGFDEGEVMAPTQPAVGSVKKRSRASLTPLRTPHLMAQGRRSTPAAKTPAPFKQPTSRQPTQPLHLRGVQKRGATGGTRGKKEPPSTLPKSLTKSIFAHFSKARVSRNAADAVEQASSKFFRNMSLDLTAFCKHAGRVTIEQADVELLMRRQRLVSDKEPLQVLIEKYLPMEYRKELIPMARSGNKVYPKIPKKKSGS